MYTCPSNDALYNVCRDDATPVYLKPARKSSAMIGAVNTVNTANTVNSMNIVNIANIVDFNAMRYKKQYKDSP